MNPFVASNGDLLMPSKGVYSNVIACIVSELSITLDATRNSSSPRERVGLKNSFGVSLCLSKYIRVNTAMTGVSCSFRNRA